jgi:hypothetical protein
MPGRAPMKPSRHSIVLISREVYELLLVWCAPADVGER